MVKVTTKSKEVLQICCEERIGKLQNEIVIEMETEEAVRLFKKLLIQNRISEAVFEATTKKGQQEGQEKLIKEKAENKQSNPNNPLIAPKENTTSSKKRGELKRSILKYMEEEGEVTKKEISEHLNCKLCSVSSTIQRLEKKGVVVKITRGIYQLASKETTEKEAQRRQELLEGISTTTSYQIKDFFGKARYEDVLEYIFTKRAFKVKGIRERYSQQEEAIKEVIIQSIAEGFIEEEKDKIGTYNVLEFARLWYYLKKMGREIGFNKILSDNAGKINEEELKKAISDGEKKELIVRIKKGNIITYKAV